MLLKKAGECLSYGIGNELLQQNKDDEDIPNYALKAFITYFALSGYLSYKSVQEIYGILMDFTRDEFKLKRKFLIISKILIRDLKNKFHFDNFDQLITELNNIEIPFWAFETKGKLLPLFPQVYLINDLIYYINEDMDRCYFRCVHVSQAYEILDYSHDYFEDFDTELVSYVETNHTISNKYSEILGFNVEKHILYLKPHHTNSLYVEYHTDSKQEIVQHYKCLGVIDNKIPVVKVNDNLCIVLGEEVKQIKKMDFMEEYVVRKDCIYVYAKSSVHTMFKPYLLLLDGERMEIPYQESVDYVMQKMKSDMFDIEDLLSENKGDESKGKENTTRFTLDYLESVFLQKYNLNENQEARMYHFLVKLLKNYLPADQDVLDYFFMFADATKRLTEKVDFHFIGESVYWRLNELHLSGKLSRIVKNIDKLKKKLLQDAYWDDEAIMEERERYCFNEYVGYFSVSNGRINAYTETTDKAFCVGDLLIAKRQEMPGIVALNMETGGYEIQYERELSNEEIQLVLEKFHIIDVAYRVSVDRRK